MPLINWFLKKAPKRNLTEIRRCLLKGGLSATEQSMIEGILAMESLSARDVMVPRVDVVAISLLACEKELVETSIATGHSRFPVYDQHIDDIKGVFHIKHILTLRKSANAKTKSKAFDLDAHLSLPFFVPEAMGVLAILTNLQKKRQQMAIVVDEYGGFSGVVTMEDILEEVIGDVQDELDEEKEEIIQVSKRVYSVDARTTLETVNEALGLKLQDEKADTIGGYIINEFGYIPKKGEEVEKAGARFKISSKRANSIIQVQVSLLSPALPPSALRPDEAHPSPDEALSAKPNPPAGKRNKKRASLKKAKNEAGTADKTKSKRGTH